MLAVLLSLSAAAIAPDATGAAFTLGTTAAAACSRAAEERAPSAAAFGECDLAIRQALTKADRVAALVNRGALALIEGDFPGAERDFDAAIVTQPKAPEAWLNKALSLTSRGQHLASLRYFDRAIELKVSDTALAYLGRGLAKESAGNASGAYQDLQAARRLSPKWNAPRAELARYSARGE